MAFKRQLYGRWVDSLRPKQNLRQIGRIDQVGLGADSVKKSPTFTLDLALAA